MSRTAIVLVTFLVLASAALGTYGTETVITEGGSVLTGVIESGLPATISITSSTGDVFTAQRVNIKHIRFGEDRAVTVETFDGNIIVGTLGGVSDVFGLRTTSGDVQSLSVDSIVEIRFEPEATTTATVTPPSTTSATQPVAIEGKEALVQAVLDGYDKRTLSFTAGIDSGLQLGLSMKNGFGAPRFTVGVNGILFGFALRLYFPPSLSRIEYIAEGLVDDGWSDFDALFEEVRQESPILVPYVQLGTDALTIPHLGAGALFRLSKMAYFDLGGTIDTLGVPWVSIGVLFFF
jgi:hypothetical protein